MSLSKVHNLLTDSQIDVVTAWQWLKLEWPWAVLALLFGAVLLGVCVRIVRNRRQATLVVEGQESTSPEVTQEDIEKELISAAVSDGPTTPGFEEQREHDDRSASQVARDLRIRAEIEALHQARVEQRQRIEAQTLGRDGGGDRRREPVGPRKSNHIANLFTAVHPEVSEFSPANGTQSAARRAASTSVSQTESAEDFRFITSLFDDPSPDVRNVAARALYRLQSDRAASFTRALREGSPERRRRIGAALASSGLATEALSNLAGQNLDKAYVAFSVLFLMAKAGEVQSLIKEIEYGPNLEVRLAVVKLLALSGQAEVVSAFRRLAVRSSLPPEVRSAVMEAIHQIRTL
jgi:hypothetical protein